MTVDVAEGKDGALLLDVEGATEHQVLDLAATFTDRVLTCCAPANAAKTAWAVVLRPADAALERARMSA